MPEPRQPAEAAGSPVAPASSTPTLLSIEDLVVEYPTPGWRAAPKRVLHGVSLQVGQGRTLGLVGESGSGKSTIGRAVLGLAPVASGTIRFDDRDITRLRLRDRRHLSRDVQVVFQDPYTSLNPSMTVTEILAEPLRFAGVPRDEARRRIAELLDQVGMPAGSGRRLPREFSGGQRQRIAIARALSLSPRLIVCDEPVSALDLSTQARVLDLLVELQRETGVSYLFVSHDLSVIRHVSHEVAVLYRGEVVETGEAEQVTGDPQHEYTRRLWMAAPVPDPQRQAERRRLRQAAAATARA